MAELAALPRAAVVVEEGYSKIFKHPHVAGSVAAERLAEIQAQFPAVPIVFCETRPLAEEWTYRWLGACQYELELVAGTSALEESFSRALEAYATAPPIRPKPAAIRAWARQAGWLWRTKANSTRDPGGLGRSPSSALVPTPHQAGATELVTVS